MKHPAIKHDPESAAGSAIPWSPESEHDLRGKISFAWYEMWAYFLGGVVFFSLAFLTHHSWLLPLGGLSIGYGITRLYALALLSQKLGEPMRRGANGEFFEGCGMLANKPRSTQRLTMWIEHSPRERTFICSGAAHSLNGACFFDWNNAQWIPNYDPEHFGEAEYPSTVDPGGGRLVILCPCGIGHFKLKLLTEQDIVDRASAIGSRTKEK